MLETKPIFVIATLLPHLQISNAVFCRWRRKIDPFQTRKNFTVNQALPYMILRNVMRRTSANLAQVNCNWSTMFDRFESVSAAELFGWYVVWDTELQKLILQEDEGRLPKSSNIDPRFYIFALRPMLRELMGVSDEILEVLKAS